MKEDTMMARFSPVTVLLLSACFRNVMLARPNGYTRPAIGMNQNIQMKLDMVSLKRRVTHLENENHLLRAGMASLENAVYHMNRTLFAMIGETASTGDDGRAELTERVDALEERVDVIIDQEGIDLSETELDRFLGNAEAQLVDLEMDPDFDPAGIPTIPPVDVEEMTVDQADLLGGALYSINRQNALLTSKVAALEQEVESTGGGQGANSFPTLINHHETERLENRVNQLERLVVTQAASGKPTGHQSNGFRLSGIQSASGPAAREESGPLTDAEREALQGIVASSGIGEVSMFSVARTGSMFGKNRVPKPVPYEIELTNKGGIYHGENGTFTCTIPGYYFITFTARTFDHKYLGVNLMKNEESLTALFSDKHARNVMQTQSIIVHVARGDQLWLRMAPSDKFALHSDRYHLTTFTGFLLYPGDP